MAVSDYLRENRKQEIFFDRRNKEHYMSRMFHGFDMDRIMLRIGAMNMMTHGVENPMIEYRDSLSDQNPDREKYSLILANNPSKKDGSNWSHHSSVCCASLYHISMLF